MLHIYVAIHTIMHGKDNVKLRNYLGGGKANGIRK